jgi:ATP-dependent Clp protease ATP-binding subunit ClpB
MKDIILPLDPNQRSTDTMEFQTALRAKIVGQEEGVQALVDLYQVFCAGLNSPGRPVGNLLFLGPTGSGKTRICSATRARSLRWIARSFSTRTKSLS